MKSITSLSILLTVIVAIGGCTTNHPRTISTKDILYPVNVIGILGKPLGARVMIEGIRAEHIIKANPLEVSQIDGNKLDKPVCIQIQGEIEIRKGIRYRLEGYEAGAFEGPPDWLGPSQQDFQFREYFIVTEVIEPKPK